MFCKRMVRRFTLWGPPFTIELETNSCLAALKKIFNFYLSEHFINGFDSLFTSSNPRMHIFAHVNDTRKTKMLTKQLHFQSSHMKERCCYQPTMKIEMFIHIQWVPYLHYAKTKIHRDAQYPGSIFIQELNSTVVVRKYPFAIRQC